MRVAILVLGYRAPQVLSAACRVYAETGWDIFVHLDAKADLARYKAELADSQPLCTFVENPTNIFWGGYSMMEAEFSLIATARHNGKYDCFVLLSDDTFPVLEPGALARTIADGFDHITCRVQAKQSEFYRRYYNFYFFDHPSLNPRGQRWPLIDVAAYAGVSQAFELQKLGKKPIDVYHGSQFWALSTATIGRVLEVCHADSHLRDSFRYSALPDELMIQSLVGNYAPTARTSDGPVFADFSKGHGPLLYSAMSDLPAHLPQHCGFIRKMAPSALEFGNAIANRLIRGSSLYHNGEVRVEDV